MTSLDLPKAIDDLKAGLLADAAKRLAEFKDRTGLTPTSIRYELTDMTQFGDALKQRQLTDVRIGLGEY